MRALGIEGDPLVRASADPQFGDYQSNCAMGLAKRMGKPPRQVATELVSRFDPGDLWLPPQIAGPGFINFRLSPDGMARRLAAIPALPRQTEIPPKDEAEGMSVPHAGTVSDRLGVAPVARPLRVVVDFSSPNLAKEMHVGHLRSTVIGDCVCRILEFLGHDVIRENHIGDWGTQFGMLVAYLRRTRPDVLDAPDRLVISDIESFYVQAKSLFDADTEFRKQSQETVVALQQGDATTRRIWKAFCDESLRHCHRIYDRLGVRLIDRGESYYNDLMPVVIERLVRSGHAVESDGALCVFLEGFKSRDGDPLPLMIRKSDGGYNYATSDLATLIHRVETLQAQRIIYVVGIPQKLHFEMLFACARATGLVGPDVVLEHLGFGSMLARSGAPFKTREGGTIKLKSLLDEAVARARQVLESSGGAADDDAELSSTRRTLRPEQIDRVAETVGLAAVKYYDLSHNLLTDYRFDLDAMTALDGNTAPYMLYAYARIRAIARKGGVDFAALPPSSAILLEHPAEIALARAILRLHEVIAQAAAELRPNLLTDYLFDLSKTFSRFYDRKLGVRVLDAPTEALKLSRLRLCDLTARTLKLVLSLLGIDTLEQM